MVKVVPRSITCGLATGCRLSVVGCRFAMMVAAQKIASAAVVTLINVQRMCTIESVSSTRNIAPLPYRNAVPISRGPRLRRSALSAIGIPRAVRLRIAMRVEVIATPSAQTRVSVPHCSADAGGSRPPAESYVAQTLLSVLLQPRGCKSLPQPQQRALFVLPDHIRRCPQPPSEYGYVSRGPEVLGKTGVLRRHQRKDFAAGQEVAGTVVAVGVAIVPPHRRQDHGDGIARLRVLANAFEKPRILRP